jgi:hypothetical protein
MAKNTEQEKLTKELKALIPKLDEDGLTFLIEQAQVHLYNMQVDELNKTIEKNAKREAARKPAPGTKAGKAAAGTASGGTGGFNEIKISDSGTSYYIVYKTEWIMFAKEEIMALVKIASGKGTDLEIKERLFNWLARERSDLLRSAGIAAKFDKKLTSLAGLLKKTFKIRTT